MRKLIKWAIVVIVVYVCLAGALLAIMYQPPRTFGRIILPCMTVFAVGFASLALLRPHLFSKILKIAPAATNLCRLLSAAARHF